VIDGRLTVRLAAGDLPAHGRYATELVNTVTPFSVTIPVTPAEPASAAVPEGVYLVRTLLPTGEQLTATVEVTAGAEAAVTVQTGGLPTPRMKGSDGPSVAVWLRAWGDDGPEPWPADVTAAPDPAGRVVLRVPLVPGWHSLQVGGRGVAWRVLRLPPAETCRIVLDRVDDEDDFDDGVRVRAWGGDRWAESVLRYLAAGQTDLARAMAGDLHVAAGDEMPATAEAACAAGYLLVRSRGTTRLPWFYRAASRFDTVPDLHILNGTLLLRERGVSRQQLGRAALLEAHRLGLPHYTEGLRLLFDGLRWLAASGGRDTAVESAVAELQKYAAACDWTGQQTSFWGRGPGMPSLRRIDGDVPDGNTALMLRVGR
jgi:hypothetical protein